MESLIKLVKDKVRSSLIQLDDGLDIQENGLGQIETGQTQQGIDKIKRGKEIMEHIYMDLSDMCDKLEAGE